MLFVHFTEKRGMYLSNIRRDLKNQRYIADGDQQEKKTINQFKKKFKKNIIGSIENNCNKTILS